MNLPKIPWKTIGMVISKHAPSILTGVGIGGFFTATIMAARATPDYIQERNQLSSKTAKDEILTVARHYWPTATVMATSTACVLLANHINLQRQAALAAACSLTETTLQNYKAKVKEVLGEKEEQKVEHQINSEIIDDPKTDIQKDLALYPIDMQVIIDKFTGTKFYLTVETVRQIVNEFNGDLLESGYCPYYDLWNRLYECAANKDSIEEPEICYQFGWKCECRQDLINAKFDYHTRNGQPVVVMSFQPEPKADIRYW